MATGTLSRLSFCPGDWPAHQEEQLPLAPKASPWLIRLAREMLEDITSGATARPSLIHALMQHEEDREKRRADIEDAALAACVQDCY